MAVIRKSSKGGNQKLNTSSLPDIVFMLLFFFMVSTSMKEVTMIVSVTLPKATVVTMIVNKSLVSYFYVGEPML